MRNIRRFLLVDNCDNQFTDLITFEKDVDFDEVVNAIQKIKNEVPYEYTNEDIYDGLKTLGIDYKIDCIGQLDVIEY